MFIPYCSITYFRPYHNSTSNLSFLKLNSNSIPGIRIGNDINPTAHYNNFIMGTMTSQITDVSIAYSTICSGADQRNHQSSASLAYVWEIHRWPVNSPRKGPVTRKMFPFDCIMMTSDSELWPQPRTSALICIWFCSSEIWVIIGLEMNEDFSLTHWGR